MQPNQSIFKRLKSAPYGAYAIDFQQSIVFWNDQAQEILGLSKEEVLGRKCYEAVKMLSLDGFTPICTRKCPAIVAAHHGRIPPVSHAKMVDATGHHKRVTVFPLIATDQNDQPILIHMFHETPVDETSESNSNSLVLTPRERTVLCQLALGLRPKDIAEKLAISVHTVRKHIYNASEKLHSNGMLSAVLAAQRRRLI